MGSPTLGRVQLLIMQVLWEKGRATARELTDGINEIEPIAHSTVQTLLRGLEEKSAVAHEADGRTFVFVPLVKEQAFRKTATRDLVERVFGGKAASLVAHLLKNENVSRAEIDEIRKLIDQASQSRKGESKKMMSHLFMALWSIGTGTAEILVNWWLQSTLLIGAGLLCGAMLKDRGAALQSAVYRATLIAALFCPFATGLLAIGGASGWSVRLPVELISRNANQQMPEVMGTHDSSSQVLGNLPFSNKPPMDIIPKQSVVVSSAPGLSVTGEEPAVNAASGRFPDAYTNGQQTEPTTSGSVAVTSSSTSVFGWIAVCGSAVWVVLVSVFAARLSSAWWRS